MRTRLRITQNDLLLVASTMPYILQQVQYVTEFAEFQPTLNCSPRVQTDTHTVEKLQVPNRFISLHIVKKQNRVNGQVSRKTKQCQKKLLNADYAECMET
jgi:hypothetical protein